VLLFFQAYFPSLAAQNQSCPNEGQFATHRPAHVMQTLKICNFFEEISAKQTSMTLCHKPITVLQICLSSWTGLARNFFKHFGQHQTQFSSTAIFYQRMKPFSSLILL
jgi:hypothetical protein